jgi:predicted DsbA family dithiol-disulfide isomerase
MEVNQMEKKLTVQVWSDVICPWCWIAERRFQQALVKFAHRSQVDIVHRAYRLKFGEARRPVEEMLAKKFGPHVNPLQFLSQMEAVAAQDGLAYRLAGTCVGDTLDAHRVLKLAQKYGIEHPVLETFYRGYFSEHEDLLEKGTLVRLAQSAGLETSTVEALFAGDDFLAKIESDQSEAAQRGIMGVPYFLFGEKTSLKGAQPEDLMASTLARAWETESVLPEQSTDVHFCGPEGCTIP